MGKRWVNFDAEVSADGETLYAVDSRFSADGTPLTADLFMARRRDGAFERTADSDDLFHLVNTNELEYAPAVSSDGLELFFTRDHEIRADAEPRIWRSVRAACGNRSPRRKSSAPFQASLKRPRFRRTACRFTTTRAWTAGSSSFA